MDLAPVNFTRVSAGQVAVALAGGIPNCQCVCVEAMLGVIGMRE